MIATNSVDSLSNPAQFLEQNLLAKCPSKRWAAIVYNETAGYSNHYWKSYAASKSYASLHNKRWDRNIVTMYETIQNSAHSNHSRMRLIATNFSRFIPVPPIGLTIPTGADKATQKCAEVNLYGNNANESPLGNLFFQVMVQRILDPDLEITDEPKMDVDSIRAVCAKVLGAETYLDLRPKLTYVHMLANFDAGLKEPYFFASVGQLKNTGVPQYSVSDGLDYVFKSGDYYWALIMDQKP